MNLPPQQLEAIRRYFQHQPVLRAYLFGSFVRGEGTESSDVDLLVELDYAQRIGLGFVQMQFDLEDLLQRKVDLVSAKGLSRHLAPSIDAEKRLIYAR